MHLLLLSLLGCGPGLKLAWDVQPGDYSPVPAATGAGNLVTSSYDPYDAGGTILTYPREGGTPAWTARAAVGPSLPIPLDGGGDVVVNDTDAVYVLDADDGHEVWRLDDPGMASYTAVDAGLDTVYAARYHQDQGATYELLAIQDGTRLWSALLDGMPSSLAVGADGTVYVATTRLLALDPDGEELWTAAIAGTPGFISLSRDHVLVPIYGQAPDPSGTTAYARADGAVVWTSALVPYGEAVVGDDGAVYMGTYDGLYAVDGETGETLWGNGEMTFAVSLGGDGRVYGMASMPEDPELPELGSLLHFFVASSDDGEILWKEHQHDALEVANGGPNFDGGRVYFAGGYFYAHVYAFDRGPGLGGGPWPRTFADAGNRRQEQ